MKDVEIIEGHECIDTISLLVKSPPKISVSFFIGCLKRKSTLMIFEIYTNLKYKYGNRKFWCIGYYVSTVGLNEKTIAKHIK